MIFDDGSYDALGLAPLALIDSLAQFFVGPILLSVFEDYRTTDRVGGYEESGQWNGFEEEEWRPLR